MSFLGKSKSKGNYSNVLRSNDDWIKFTTPKLKSLLAERKLIVTGAKAELVQRMKEYLKKNESVE